jgi:hypothetical protein
VGWEVQVGTGHPELRGKGLRVNPISQAQSWGGEDSLLGRHESKIGIRVLEHFADGSVLRLHIVGRARQGTGRGGEMQRLSWETHCGLSPPTDRVGLKSTGESPELGERSNGGGALWPKSGTLWRWLQPAWGTTWEAEEWSRAGTITCEKCDLPWSEGEGDI